MSVHFLNKTLQVITDQGLSDFTGGEIYLEGQYLNIGKTYSFAVSVKPYPEEPPAIGYLNVVVVEKNSPTVYIK